MATKSRKAAKRGNIYETVSNNIQKITRPSGTVSYRVRVTEDGVMYSQYETSLKKASSKPTGPNFLTTNYLYLL